MKEKKKSHNNSWQNSLFPYRVASLWLSKEWRTSHSRTNNTPGINTHRSNPLMSFSRFIGEDSIYQHKICQLNANVASLIRRIRSMAPVIRVAPPSPTGAASASPRSSDASTSPSTSPSHPAQPCTPPLTPVQVSSAVEMDRWQKLYAHLVQMLAHMHVTHSVGLIIGCVLRDFFCTNMDGADVILCCVIDSIDVDCKQVSSLKGFSFPSHVHSPCAYQCLVPIDWHLPFLFFPSPTLLQMTFVKKTLPPHVAEHIFQATLRLDFSQGFPTDGLPPVRSSVVPASTSPQPSRGQIGHYSPRLCPAETPLMAPPPVHFGHRCAAGSAALHHLSPLQTHEAATSAAAASPAVGREDEAAGEQ